MITILGLWSWFRGSIIAQIGAGVLAFLAIWKINNINVARKTEAKIEQKAIKKGKARNEKVDRIRDDVPRNGAWDRLREHYRRPR